MLTSPLTNFEIKSYDQDQDEPRFNGVYSRNNWSKSNDEAYVINLDEYKSIRTHWVVLYVNGNNGSASYDAIDFESFGVKHIPK